MKLKIFVPPPREPSPPEIFEAMYKATNECRWAEAFEAMHQLRRAGWLVTGDISRRLKSTPAPENAR